MEPLTIREGRTTPSGPHEGVPGHLREPIRQWLDSAFGCEPGYAGMKVSRGSAVFAVTTACRIELPRGAGAERAYHEIISFCYQDPDQFLDVVHFTIQVTREQHPVQTLERVLEYGGSVWRATQTGLQRRVGPTTQKAFDVASRPADVASEELKHAWVKAYGRDPDGSDAWDHAIKAVEAILVPIVVPNQVGPHMGHVVGQLDHHGDQWSLRLESNQGISPVETFVGMLRLLWPNPDRHVGPAHRVPTLQEAQAVVQLAVTIVQWARDGQILTK